MKKFKFTHKKLILSALAVFALVPAGGAANPLLGSDLTSFVILAGEYAVTGAGSTVTGNVGADSYITTGLNNFGYGSSYAGSYIATGANFVSTGQLYSGSYITTGAGSSNTGSNYAVGYIEVGANSFNGGSNNSSSYITLGGGSRSSENNPYSPLSFRSPVSNALNQLKGAKTALSLITATTTLAATMSGTQTLFAGVYNAPAITTAASTHLTLDGQGALNPLWLFNIDTYLSTGAFTAVDIINSGPGAEVIWNTGGYGAFGANTQMIGTVLSGSYISTGADATSGPLLASGYVTLGANGKVSCLNCAVSVASAVPEPETYALMLAGLGMVIFITRCSKKKHPA
ncbi:ice-binding family protein [Actimicrobium sp. CCI2.3]|uniref:ice-binding family protein n=1 Tax=Actimicrobium sp. CCI2.3 TaxID=3048616 RepID=UPI002AB43E86|nr:ice-binding family protein [Actimicrobium sp. CCI2.3]MDY7576707.1 ice-binding family protein [Actimicrobium sp. CCI2.3]MEB0024046.1 ice-binding family protein [Actimicrobium sp. CCI2.3]